MALGTPVAAAAAYSANGGTTVAPAYPAGILATDVVLLLVGQKPSTANGGTVTTPTGWTLREELTGAGGYGATLGADTGNTNLRIYSWNTPVAGQTGNLTVTIGTNNISWAFMIRIPTGGGTIVYGSADGSRTTAPTSGTPYTVLLTNGTSATNLKAGDVAIWAMCIPTDVLGGAGFSAHTISATGTTFNTPTELNEPSSGTGNDIGGYSVWVSATAGSATVAPTIGATATGTVTNVRGPIALVRIRELPFINAESTSFSYTGQDTTLAAGRNINAEAGSFSYLGQDAELIITAAPKELDAEAGTFSYLGQDATLTTARSINAAAGSFSYLGQDATLTATRALSADAGTFLYLGQNADLMRSYSLNAEAGTFSYLGQDATLLRTFSFNAEAGTFSYLGQDATLIYTPAQGLNAEAGTFSIAGQDATLAWARDFSAQAGSYTYTGQDATLVQERNLNAASGSFEYLGQDATFTRTFNLDAQAGSFTYTGEDATFLRGYALKADAAAFGEANPYVDPGYVDPYYSTNLTAALAYGRMFNAQAGAFTYTGQDATFIQGRLYPLESDVRAGVIYGPGGIYTGTMSAGSLFIFDD